MLLLFIQEGIRPLIFVIKNLRNKILYLKEFQDSTKESIPQPLLRQSHFLIISKRYYLYLLRCSLVKSYFHPLSTTISQVIIIIYNIKEMQWLPPFLNIITITTIITIIINIALIFVHHHLRLHHKQVTNKFRETTIRYLHAQTTSKMFR